MSNLAEKEPTEVQELQFKAEFLDEIKDLALKPIRIKIPTGGGTVWEIPNGVDKPTILPNFDAIILFHNKTRGYYVDAFSGGHNPPQCSSEDAITGVGDPGGSCSRCPNSVWGSKENGSGTACNERMSLYLIRGGETFPMVLSLPVTSIDWFTQYRVGLAQQKKLLRRVLTNFSLVKVESKTGIAYSVVRFTFAGDISPEDVASTAYMRESIKNMVQSKIVPPVPESVTVGHSVDGFTDTDIADTDLPF